MTPLLYQQTAVNVQQYILYIYKKWSSKQYYMVQINKVNVFIKVSFDYTYTSHVPDPVPSRIISSFFQLARSRCLSPAKQEGNRRFSITVQLYTIYCAHHLYMDS